jgi:dihydroxyacid dehydratase/phosphogluconate dehydratase
VPDDQFDGRPVIGIGNTFRELTPCNSHFRTLAEQVRIGVYEADGFLLEFSVMSLGETLLRQTAMLYRKLAGMDVEESIRGNPLDGVVLLMGCNKTTPALAMGAASVEKTPSRLWRPLAAIGGSTKAVIHLIAMAGRIGVKLTIDDFDRLASELPCLVTLQPSGKYLTEDFLRKGITDMVGISDARMSGTACGTVILHTAPEAVAGGPLALVHNGDIIELGVPSRRLHLHASDEELATRLALW